MYGPSDQIGARQLEIRLVDDQVAVEQHVEIHRPRRPLRRQAGTPAGLFDCVQVAQQLAHRLRGGDLDDEIDEIVAGETHCGIAVGGETRSES